MRFYHRFYSLIIIGLVSIILCHSSCNTPEPLQYRNVRNLTIQNLSLTQPIVGLDVELFNPNSYGLDVKEAMLQVYINDKYAGTANLQNLITVPAKTNFNMPVRLQADLGQLLSNALQILLNNEVQLKVDGYVKAGKGLFIKIPVTYQGKQRLNKL